LKRRRRPDLAAAVLKGWGRRDPAAAVLKGGSSRNPAAAILKGRRRDLAAAVLERWTIALGWRRMSRRKGTLSMDKRS
jgi:hypothetical protein